MQRSLIFVAAIGITSFLYINFCATVFQCGCASLWNGADAHCNVHLAGARHCPWCGSLMLMPYAGIVAVQAAVSFWPRPMSQAVRLIAALAAFPAAGAVIAAAFGIASGYGR